MPEVEKAGGHSPIRSRTDFRHKVLRMLLSKGKITEEMIRMLSGWKHTGFNVFCGSSPSRAPWKRKYLYRRHDQSPGGA